MDSIENRSAKLTSANLGDGAGTRIENQLNSHVDIGNAHKFFSPGVETHAAASLSPIPGSESAALATIPGAQDPISPLVQMIMRLPGHIGLLNSFFEALSAFFFPHTDLLAGFDPSVLGAHATGSSLTGSFEHGTIDPAILPPEAHVFDGLDTTFTSDLSFKTAWNMNLHDKSLNLFNSDLTVSAQPDISNATYENPTSHLETNSLNQQAGGTLAGPGISQSVSASHLAGSHPIFNKDLFDRAGAQSNGAMLASAPSNATGTTLAQNLGNSQSALTPQSTNALYVSGNPVASHMNTGTGLSELGTSGINTGATNASFSFVPRNGLDLGSQNSASASSFGPSGAVSDNLGAKNILGGNDELASNFHQSTLNSTTSSDMVSHETLNNQFKESVQAPLKGLRANELSLDGHKLAKLPHSHHSSTAQASSAHKNSAPTSHSSNKPATVDSHKSAAIKPHNSASPSQNAKASPVDSEREKVAMSDRTTPVTNTDQTNLETGTHTVHAGDSLWKVAEEHLGDATRWPDIYKLNIDKIGANPDLIHTGLKLDLPEHAQNIATSTQPSTEYIVKAGDNLWDISKHAYGSGTHWSELYHINSDVIGSNPSLIFPGEKLSIPSTDASTAVANAPTAPAANAADATAQPAAHSDQLADASPAQTSQTINQATSHATKTVTQVASTPPVTEKLAYSGPGAADAKVPNQFTTTTGNAPVVSPSLAPDLSFFTRKR
jgi:nucleoid-associated protein YgaU